MKGIITSLLAVAAIGAGCASHDHVYYSRPVSEPVVVQRQVVVTPPTTVVTPAPTVVVPAITERNAMEIARAEAFHHGWRNTTVERARFLNERWLVDLYNEPHHHVETYGWAEIAPDGSVLAFSTSPHRRSYSEYRRR